MTPQTPSTRSTAPALEVERSAYNAAFYELGLGWHWSADTFQSLSTHGDPCERIRHYMEQQHPHLLRAYDAEFLASAIECRLAELRRGGSRHAGVPPRHAGVVETKVAQTGF
ncbi:MAG TPA: hypothetical protein VHM00_11400 [Caldimonas sp.]|jgi:hypothetical protein|nr:hypothetical protein [Caldimonas sp.]HEX2541673.1 hypothetical protein [Caldimonas sp.]